MKLKLLLLFFVASLALLLPACGKGREEYEKTGEVDFTVVKEEDVPTELKKIVDEKKAGDFRLTYLAEDALYIATGYGEQTSGGYSICVEELYMAKEGICVKTKLMGPAANEQVTTNLTYPYLVLKLKPVTEEVIFLK